MATETGVDAARDLSFVQLLERRARVDGNRVAVRQERDGAWVDATWSDLHAQVVDLARGLAGLGVESGDRVGLLLRPRVEALVALLAVQALDATPCCLYPTTPEDTVELLIAAVDARAVVVEPAWEGIFRARGLPCVAVPGPRDATSWERTLSLGRSESARDIEERLTTARGDEQWTIYFTSGTTGVPKGVPLSDRMILTAGYFDLFGDGLLQPPGEADRTFHEIPIGSVAGPIFGIYYPLVFGCVAYIPAEPDQAAGALREASPTVYLTFPRLWELRMSEALARVQSRSRLYRSAYRAAMWARSRAASDETPSFFLRLADRLAHRTICRPLLARWGFADLQLVLTGGATLTAELIRQWRHWGVTIRQIYGQTESGGLATIQTERHPPTGFAGRCGPRMELRISDAGEILLRGEGVFDGYLNRPDATAAVLDEDGWFRTGDAGVVDADGNLRVLDRMSDLLTLADGRTFAASELESALKRGRFVRNAIVAPGAASDVVALIELDEAAADEWARQQRLTARGYVELVQVDGVVELVRAEVDAASRSLTESGRPVIAAHRLLPAPIDLTDPLQATPTRKVRRAQLLQMYDELVSEMRAAQQGAGALSPERAV